MFIVVLIALLCVGVWLQTDCLQHAASQVTRRAAVLAAPAALWARQPRARKAALHTGFMQHKRRVPHAPLSASCCWSSGLTMATPLR